MNALRLQGEPRPRLMDGCDGRAKAGKGIKTAEAAVAAIDFASESRLQRDTRRHPHATLVLDCLFGFWLDVMNEPRLQKESRLWFHSCLVPCTLCPVPWAVNPSLLACMTLVLDCLFAPHRPATAAPPAPQPPLLPPWDTRRLPSGPEPNAALPRTARAAVAATEAPSPCPETFGRAAAALRGWGVGLVGRWLQHSAARCSAARHSAARRSTARHSAAPPTSRPPSPAAAAPRMRRAASGCPTG